MNLLSAWHLFSQTYHSNLLIRWISLCTDISCSFIISTSAFVRPLPMIVLMYTVISVHILWVDTECHSTKNRCATVMKLVEWIRINQIWARTIEQNCVWFWCACCVSLMCTCYYNYNIIGRCPIVFALYIIWRKHHILWLHLDWNCNWY